MDELSKPTVGDKLLKQLEETQSTPKGEDVSTIISPPKVEESVPEVTEVKDPVKPDDYKSYIKGGVEVVDVKAIEKDKKKLEIPKWKVDKFGIPINPGEHRNFDRI